MTRRKYNVRLTRRPRAQRIERLWDDDYSAAFQPNENKLFKQHIVPKAFTNLKRSRL